MSDFRTTVTVPAIRGQMGSTEYFQAVMRAKDLTAIARPAHEFAIFDEFEPDAQMQRELSQQRVEKQIVPYLMHSADRFFGSIIVLVYEPETFEFEPLDDGAQRPKAYRDAFSKVGTLSITSGAGTLFALDGQHRLLGLRLVIEGGETPKLKIPIDGEFADDIGNDELSVIFLPFTSKVHARRVFNKVNRYAKPTTRDTNIITSEDDGLAIVARCLAHAGDPQLFGSSIASPIVRRWPNGSPTTRLDGNSLKRSDPEFTTLQTLYKATASVVEGLGLKPIDEATTIVRPKDEHLREAYEQTAAWWSLLIKGFLPFKEAHKSYFVFAEWRHDFDHPYGLALRPITQKAIFDAMSFTHKSFGTSPEDFVERLSRINWTQSHSMWRGILVGGGKERYRILSNPTIAHLLIAYMVVGEETYGEHRTSVLRELYRTHQEGHDIPRRVFPRAVA